MMINGCGRCPKSKTPRKNVDAIVSLSWRARVVKAILFSNERLNAFYDISNRLHQTVND